MADTEPKGPRHPNPFGPAHLPKPPPPLELAYDPMTYVAPAPKPVGDVSDFYPRLEPDPETAKRKRTAWKTWAAGLGVFVLGGAGLIFWAMHDAGDGPSSDEGATTDSLRQTVRHTVRETVQGVVPAALQQDQQEENRSEAPTCPEGAVWVYEGKDGTGIVDRYDAIPSAARATARCRKL